MTGLDRTDPVIVGHLLAQHRELFARLLAARAAFTAADGGGPEGLRGIMDCLRELREHLACHFGQEESGGFLEESIARVPRLAAATGRVLAEHPALLAELDRLIETLATADISRLSWHQAARDFETFVEHLQAHERNENAVVQEGYNEDLGLD
jgi:iron-sulfur cluster repair protein YtfE (RIC family)